MIWFWLTLFSLLSFFGSLALGGWLIIRLPSDYLIHEPKPASTRSSISIRQSVAWVVKNLIGGVMMLAGVVMLFTPGQGLLFLFLGLTLVSIPGKHRLIRQLLERPQILNRINDLRRRANRPDLISPESKASPAESR